MAFAAVYFYFMRTSFTIVVADDDIDDQELAKEGFEDCKVQVQVNSVFNGLQLMDYLLKRDAYKNIESTPDLIILDLNMPLMDGFNVLKEIKAQKLHTSIPIYVVTTSISKADKEKALALGAKGFFSKGFSSEDIKKVMMEICRDCFS
ncbi:MAG: response regulator [Bacteroidetes bacterium]|nr:response regulator [Bacteroidota bacterium]